MEHSALKEQKLYIVLDELDYNTFPIKYNFVNTAPLIWDVNKKLKEKTYYEFKVLAEEDTDTKNANKQFCHICAIDVPSFYINEHNNSSKHRHHQKIIDQALERTRKQVELFEGISLNESETKTYYCENCSEQVKSDKKFQHEITEDHIRSVANDKLVEKFTSLYINNFNTDDSIKSNKYDIDYNLSNTKGLCEEYDKKNDIEYRNESYISEQVKSDKKFQHEITEHHIQSLANDKLVEKFTSLFANNVNTADVSDDSDIDDNVTKTEGLFGEYGKKNYIEDLDDFPYNILNFYYIKINQLSAHTVNVIDRNILQITAVNGDTVRVNVNNFHGLIIRDFVVLCKICRQLIGGVTEVKKHKESPEHKKLVVATIYDKHCIRQLDGFWNHCILCNEIIENAEHHIKSNANHNVALKAAVFQLNKNGDDIENYVSKINENSEPATSVIKEYTQSYSRKSNSTHTVGADNSDVKNLDEEIHHLMSKSNKTGFLLCKVCNVRVSSNTKNIDEHMNGRNHIREFEKVVRQNNLCVNKTSLYCGICRNDVKHKSILDHINLEKHKKVIRDSIQPQESNLKENTPKKTLVIQQKRKKKRKYDSL